MKNKTERKIISGILASAMILSAVLMPGLAETVRADAVDGKRYVALGADLSGTERQEVLKLLGLSEEELQDCTVVEITNQDEHTYLDDYLSASVIGSRALSSVVVTGEDDGYGIRVTTKNISYCTEGMYQNALATAGIENAEITVAGPFTITGTAALVGAMKAYSAMTGEPLKAENIETATDELVTTSQLGESIGDQQKAEELIGAVKDIIVSENIQKPEKMEEVIQDTAAKLEITLTEEQVQKIMELMEKISKLDIDVEQLQEQLQNLYNKLSDMDIDLNLSDEQVNGIMAQLSNWFSGIWNQLKDFLGNIFQ